MRLHTGAVRKPQESALKVNPGTRILCHTWGLKQASVLHLAFEFDALITELSAPLIFDVFRPACIFASAPL